MSRQNKRKQAAVGKTALVDASPVQLEAQARQEIAASQYKLAIQRLKLLAKQDGCHDRAQSLFREAYTGRAEQLASQGMLKEAAAIWEVAIPHGLDPADTRYVGWLAQTNQYSRVFDIYRKLPAESRRPLQPRLAAVLLSGAASSLLTALPDEDPLRVGFEPARQLLEAWCAGEEGDQLQERMKNISFRSPYRDLRQALQAWLLLESAPQQALETLERIAPDSPFRPLADQVRLAQLDLSEALPRLTALSPAAQACHLEIRGLSDSGVVNLLRELGKLPHESTAEQLFAFLAKVKPAQLQPHIRHWWRDVIKRVFTVAQKTSSKKLANNLLDRAIGEISNLEGFHLDALAGIATEHLPLHLSSVVWEDYRDRLLSKPESGAVTDVNDIALTDRYLAAAQINIYLASLWQQKEEGLSSRSLDLLHQSLQYDPSETKIWCTLAEYYLLEGLLSEARGILKEALAHHPDDTSLLELGVRIAVAGESFKKAAGYAKRILEFDPINTRVRLYLQNAHISHARKQIKQKKWHLARKELDEAQLWKGAPVNATIIQVLHTYLTHQDGQVGKIEDGQQENAKFVTLEQLLADSDLHPAALDFLLRHESLLAGMRELALHKIFPVEDPWKKADKRAVMALQDIAGQLAKLSPETLAAPFLSLRGLLRKAARLPFTIAEGEQLCEFWVQINEAALLLEYARCLQKAWPKKPVFTYYYYYYYQGDFFEKKNAIPSLEKALKMAKSQGDEGLVKRIALLLERLCRPTSNWDDDFDFDDGETGSTDLNETDVLNAMRELTDMIQTAPYKNVFEVLCGLIDKKTAHSIRQRFGQEGVRDLCHAILLGGYPDEIIAEMEGKPVKQNPVQGRLF